MRRSLWWQMGPLRDAAGDSGDSGGGGGAFDPAKFKTELMGEVSKMVNGFGSRLEKQLAALKAPAPPAGEDDGGDPPGDPKGEKVDPKIKALEKQLAKLNESLANEQKARTETEKAAAEKERLSLIRTELAKHGLAEHAVDDAFRFFRDEIRRSESGDLVAGADEVPFTDFMKATVEKKSHWLPAKQVGGTGATAGNAGRGGAKGFDTSLIKPGMSAEEKAAAYASIGAIFQARNQ